VQRTLTSWLPRGLVVTGLTTLIALWVLVQPLSEPMPPAPTLTTVKQPAPSNSGGVAAVTQHTATPVLTDTSVFVVLPTVTPLFSPTPTNTPIPTNTPTPLPTPTATATNTPAPTATATPIPPSAQESVAAEPASVPLAGRVEQHTYFCQVTGDERPYRIYLPPSYDQTDQRYPVLYMLHGWPYDEAHWDNLGLDEAADAGIVNGTFPPFIIVLPGAGPNGLYVTTSGGDYSFEGQMVNDLIPHIDATYRTIAERRGRAIGGISRGGVWALEIGFRRADLFSAVGGYSPALSANLAPPVYDPFNLMTEPGVAELRIYLSAGDTDWARKSTRALHEALNEQGLANQFVVHPGGHRDALWAENVVEYLAFYAAGWADDMSP
jgi:enterochelin esterase-like enzyme